MTATTIRHYLTGTKVPYCKAKGYTKPYKPTVRDFITDTLKEITCNKCYGLLVEDDMEPKGELIINY